MFGELWIDRPADVAAKMPQVPDTIQRQVAQFIEDGYVIFPGAVSDETVDQILTDRNAIYDDPLSFVLKRAGQYVDPVELEQLHRAERIIDLYAVSPAARDAISSPYVAQFLKTIFEDDPVAMQSLFFEYGSQQAMHLDTAYVVAQRPLSLAACWIALEDVKQGAGELMYYPGSHRFDHYLFSGSHKNWTPKRDGPEQHQAFLKSLHTRAADQGIEKETFLARKGDILIWHADLAHGGARITLEDQTRRSLVAHFCPRSIKPNYKQFVEGTYREVEHANGMYFASRHYDLEALTHGASAGALIYDGGVTKRRRAAA